MKEQVSHRLDLLNSGKSIDKNDQILEDVVEELKKDGLYVTGLKKRKSKKAKKEAVEEEASAQEAPKKKKKKQSLADE